MAALERSLPPVVAPSVSADAIPLALRRRGGSQRQVLAMVAAGAAVLALFAAPDLPGWAERLGDGPIAQAARPIAQTWDGAMSRCGLDRPRHAVREAVRQMLLWRWE